MRLTTALRSSVSARASACMLAFARALAPVLAPVIAPALACGVALAAVASPASAQDEVLKVGSSAPALSVGEWVKGKLDAINDPNRTYLVVFLSSKGSTARAFLDGLNGMHKAHRASGLVVAIVIDEPLADVQSFVAGSSNLTINVGVDKEKKTNTDWMQAAKQDSMPYGFIVRGGRILWMGRPAGAEFGGVVKDASVGRYNPQLTKSAKEKLRAGDEAVRLKNFKDAWKHYDDVIKTDPTFFGDVAIRKYKAMLTDAKDPAGARAWGEQMLVQYNRDGVTLAEFARAIATDDAIKERDFELALRVADKFGDLGKVYAPNLALRAEINYYAGNLAQAVELQREAWIAADEEFKPTYKADYDRYKKLADKAKSKASK